MTPKEADEVAKRCTPVILDGITYIRIIEVGYRYDERGQRRPFVTVLDKNKNCIVSADPAKVKEAQA